MRLVLAPHPQSLGAAALSVDVARLPAGELTLSYVVAGRIGDLLLPPIAESVRSDELWRHTCFEAFVAASPGAGYFEFNFAPSTRWAVYRFDGYRSGMRVAAEIAAPRIFVQSAPDCFTLQANIDLSRFQRDRWRLGLAAVIEQASGDKSYFALAHPSGKPDFHHPDCFAAELPPP